MKILIDAGHGIEASCNRSPDCTLYEYAWALEVAGRLKEELERRGIAAVLVKPEERNTPLKTRVARINRICDESGSWNCLLVSIHLNAGGGNKEWGAASGFSVFVSKNASENSQHMSEIMVQLAEKRELTGNRSIPHPDKNGNRYWTWSWRQDDIYILKASKCPAVLTESGFMNNRKDCEWLKSEEGKTTMIAFHADAIEQYIKQCQ